MKKRERITRFIVAKTLLPLTSGGYLRRWYIYRNNIPIMVVNNFLRWKSINSPLTGRTYSYALAAWMNFLLDNRKNLLDAKICDLKSYVHYLVYRIDKNLLSISSKIVEEHGGRMTFYSKVSEGTTAEIVLPVNQGNNASRGTIE